jgi:tRNA threonylcarbamoyladenosine biosynthesis protein TsaB
VAQAYGEIAGQAGNDGYRFIIPMIDARRMEVYTAIFASSVIPSTSSVIPSEVEESPSYIQITETAPAIIDSESFAEYLEQGPCLFIGDGAGKCADVIKHPNAHFCQCHPKASAMLVPAMTALQDGKFQDVAYFEPFYLKEFVATISKKRLF